MRIAVRLVFAAALLTGVATAQPARAPGLAALRAFDTGLWEFRERGARAVAREICVADPITLMQLRHGAAVCSRYVLDDQPTSATLHYTCPGAGHGSTTLKVETRALIRLQSQGVASGAPFALDYEGRRRGTC